MPTPPSKKPTKRAAKPRGAVTAEKLRALADAAENAVVFLPPDKGIPFPFRSKAMHIGSVDKSLAGVINAAIRRATRAASAAGFAEGVEKAARMVEERTSSQAFEERTGRTASIDSIPSANGQELAAAIRKATPDAN